VAPRGTVPASISFAVATGDSPCFSREDPPKIVEIPAILIYFAGYEWDKDWKDRDENWGMIMNYWDMIV
jgi:hypothetical protein